MGSMGVSKTVFYHPTHSPDTKIHHGGVKKHQNYKNPNKNQPKKPPKIQPKPVPPRQQNPQTTCNLINKIFRLARPVFQPNKILFETWRRHPRFQLHSETHPPTTFNFKPREKIQPSLQNHRKTVQPRLPKKIYKNATF